MTTITLEKDLDLQKTVFKDANEMLLYLVEHTWYNFMDFEYEEYLEKKLLIAKKSPKSDFVNL